MSRYDHRKINTHDWVMGNYPMPAPAPLSTLEDVIEELEDFKQYEAAKTLRQLFPQRPPYAEPGVTFTENVRAGTSTIVCNTCSEVIATTELKHIKESHS